MDQNLFFNYLIKKNLLVRVCDRLTNLDSILFKLLPKQLLS